MYECSVCKKMLTRPGGLVDHFRLHTNEKPFKCVHCSVYFRTKHARRRHELSHLKDEDRYRLCELCGKTFSREYLSTHIKDHTGHNCTICGCHFSSIGILKKHRKEHLKSKENA
jgi:KRAB domain-containing zinc finger protein